MYRHHDDFKFKLSRVHRPASVGMDFINPNQLESSTKGAPESSPLHRLERKRGIRSFSSAWLKVKVFSACQVVGMHYVRNASNECSVTVLGTTSDTDNDQHSVNASE